MRSDHGKQLYKERAATAETHRGLDKLAIRGLPKVPTIATLAALTDNSLRVIAMGLTV
jgi:hypothetical protein